MNTIGRIVWFGVCALLGLTGCNAPAPLTVASFNIRYGTADDGPDRWELRRASVVETLRSLNPDVIGLQEVLAFQEEELLAALPEYGSVGAGRDDGQRAGEFVPILYRRERFDLVEFGHFWLSTDPERAGTVGWDAALTRMATWVRLRFRDNLLYEMVVVNTHFDHVGEQARLESAKLLRRMAESLGGQPVLVMGDFNCGPGSPPYLELTADRGNLAELHDSYFAAHPGPENGTGTYHGFKGDTSGPRIDWIMVNRRFEVLGAQIDRRDFAGRFPSDHFAVWARVAVKAP